MSNENEWISGQITLVMNGVKVEMEMTVPAVPVKPMRMLPIFQAMTSSFVETCVGAMEAQGRTVSCKAGCGACCRQAVPLAEMEAYQIAALVENMEEPRRSEIKQKFEDACRHFHETNWFERMDEYADLTFEERQTVVLEYFYDGIACPFLENESCSIHQVRPLACREYLVTSDPEHCAAPSAETVRTIKMLTEPSKILRETARSENLQKLNFVPLVRALEWARDFPEKMPEKKGTEWVTDFVNKLTDGKMETENE